MDFSVNLGMNDIILEMTFLITQLLMEQLLMFEVSNLPFLLERILEQFLTKCL